MKDQDLNAKLLSIGLMAAALQFVLDVTLFRRSPLFSPAAVAPANFPAPITFLMKLQQFLGDIRVAPLLFVAFCILAARDRHRPGAWKAAGLAGLMLGWMAFRSLLWLIG